MPRRWIRIRSNMDASRRFLKSGLKEIAFRLGERRSSRVGRSSFDVVLQIRFQIGQELLEMVLLILSEFSFVADQIQDGSKPISVNAKTADDARNFRIVHHGGCCLFSRGRRRLASLNVFRCNSFKQRHMKLKRDESRY